MPREYDSGEEVDRIRRKNVREWMSRHDVVYTVDQVLERVRVVGEEVAMAEARAGTMPIE